MIKNTDCKAAGPHGCSVCEAPETSIFVNVDGREYLRCKYCTATMLNPAQWLPAEAEFRQYQVHENSSTDSRYRKFLSKVATPLLKKLAPEKTGLDYGCGPVPVLAHILSEAGHSMSSFDPFFFPDKHLLDQTYDFITCTETIEHFHFPAKEFASFGRILRPGGWRS